MKNNDFFFLAPPLVSRKGRGFAVIQIGLDFSETMILIMSTWNGNDYLSFWFNELVSMLADKKRTKGLLPTVIHKKRSGALYFTGRWVVYRIGSEFVFQDRTTIIGDDEGDLSWKVAPKDWWTLIKEYKNFSEPEDPEDEPFRIAEWRVSEDAIADWCDKYSCVFKQMNTIDIDKYYK